MKTRNRCQGIRFVAATTLSALTPATPAADAAAILSTDFTGRIVSGKTASNIPWAAAGVPEPGDLTWVREGGGPTDTALFDTPNAQGCDLAPLYLSTPKPAWRTEFFYEHPIITSTNRIPASQALVRKGWKYFCWPDYSTEQLFDLDSDPVEENDRIADPSQAARLAEMRARFAELRAAAR
jgi:hypothetical protein